MNTVIVNDVPTQIKQQQCIRCVQDSTIPGIEFDVHGVCNFCHFHDKLENIFPNGEKGKVIISQFVEKIKHKSRGKKYDCVVGVSGGRDSTYLLYLVVKVWGLRPLAVHFNDGFDNPIADDNLIKTVKKLGVDLRTITSDWQEAKDLKIDFLKASVPDLNMGTDIGIASSLFGMANKENIKFILIGQSFRTEGVKPLSWSFFDGDYLRNVHSTFSDMPLRKWTPNNPGFNLGIKEMSYYTLIKGIKTYTPMYYHDYIRKEAEEIIKREFDWIYPGAHYFDDLYHSLIKYVHRVKFNIDMNMNSDSALVRSGQLSREHALERAHGIYSIEDSKVIDLCIQRLGLTREEFDQFMLLPPKTFRDYKTSYKIIRRMKFPIKILSMLHFLPRITYDKYFHCGK